MELKNYFISELPAELLKPLQDVTVYEKEEIILECELSVANADAIWLKDGIDVKYALGLERFNKKSSGNSYRLTVFEAKLEDLGSYSCTVKLTKTACNVNVLGKSQRLKK